MWLRSHQLVFTVTSTTGKGCSRTNEQGQAGQSEKNWRTPCCPLEEEGPLSVKTFMWNTQGSLFSRGPWKMSSSYRRKSSISFTYSCFLARSVFCNVFRYIASPWSQPPAEALHSLLRRRSWSLLIPAFESRACTWEVKWGWEWPSGQERNSKFQPQTCFCTLVLCGCRARKTVPTNNAVKAVAGLCK